MVPEVAGSNPVVHPRSACNETAFGLFRSGADSESKKLVPEVLTPLGGLFIVEASQRAAVVCRALRFARRGVPHLPLPRRKNTPHERRLKLIENRGFECIERA